MYAIENRTSSKLERFAAGLVLLFAFCLPWSKSAVSVLLAISALTVVIAAFVLSDKRAIIIKHLHQPLTFPFLAYFGAALFGIIFTEKIGEGLSIANKTLTIPLVYLVFSSILTQESDDLRREKFIELVFIAFLAGLVLLNIIAFLYYFGAVGSKKGVLPLAPMHMHHIWFSNLNAVGIYVSSALMLYGKKGERRLARMLLTAAIILFGVSILLSLSRTAWVAMLATVVAMTFLFTHKRKIFYFTILSTIIVSLFAYSFSPLVRDRVHVAVHDVKIYASGNREAGTSLGDRFLMWHASIKMFLSNPFFGVGTGDYNATIAKYVQDGLLPKHVLQYNQPHNMYLFSLATGGILGLSALLFFFVSILKHTLTDRSQKGIKKAAAFIAIATAIHYLVAGFADSLFNIFVLRHAFAFIMAVSVLKTLRTT